jgi:hypothetical protein
MHDFGCINWLHENDKEIDQSGAAAGAAFFNARGSIMNTP